MKDTPTQHFASWLCGFLDGEGSFTLMTTANGTISARVAIGVRADDWRAMHHIWETTKLGTLAPARSYSRNSPNPSIHWHVFRASECMVLVELLESAGGLLAKKAKDFELWAEAVRILVTDGGGIISASRNRLEEIRDELRAVKTYSEELAIGFDSVRGAHSARPATPHPKHFSKTTPEMIAQIRAMYATGEHTQVSIAKHFNLSTAYLNKIVRQPHD